MSIKKIFIIVFLLVFLIFPYQMSYIAPNGTGMMAELAFYQKTVYFGGFYMLTSLFFHLLSKVATPNSIMGLSFSLENLFNSLFWSFISAFVITLIVSFFVKKLKK